MEMEDDGVDGRWSHRDTGSSRPSHRETWAYSRQQHQAAAREAHAEQKLDPAMYEASTSDELEVDREEDTDYEWEDRREAMRPRSPLYSGRQHTPP